MKSKKQSGTGILIVALTFLGRSAASGAIGLGASSLLGKIFGGKIKKRKEEENLKEKLKD